MFIKFKLLWALFFGGVLYDVVVSSVGWFPERPLSVRLSEDIQVAFFIVAAWVASLIILRLEKSFSTSGGRH